MTDKPPTVTIRIDEHNTHRVPLSQARRIYTELTRDLEAIERQRYVKYVKETQ